MSSGRPSTWMLATIVLGLSAFVCLRAFRAELVDFEVYRTAAARALEAQSLYRPEDGHYQYKYLPAFALVMAPFAWLSKSVAEAVWFALSVGAVAWFVRLSLRAVPDRRMEERGLIVLGLLLVGKPLVKELAFGQTNVLLGLLMLGAALAARRGRGVAAGVLVAAGVFVKPYALVLVPWLLWVSGPGAIGAFAGVLGVGLLLPAVAYGWGGNLDQLAAWYRTVTTTTGPLLLRHENLSFASMWAKWLSSAQAPALLAAATSAAAAIGVGAVLQARRRVPTPDCLEYAVLAVLVPLVSPQGWDYLLLLALPGYLCLVDRWRDTPWPWRAALVASLVVTNFAIFDLLRRPFYIFVMERGIPTLGAVVLIGCLGRLRWRALA
jgi:hypothetical protein